MKIRWVILPFISLMPLLLASPAVSIARITGDCLHFIRFCFATLSKIDSVLHAIPWTLAAMGLVIVVVRRVAPALTTSRLIRRLPSRSPRYDETTGEIAQAHAVLERVKLISASSPNPAFTSGILKPCIYISERLQATLTYAELESVILHEAHHARRRDPMRYMLAAAVADFLFWVPIVRDSARSLAARFEFEADDAARRVGDLVLASAILRVADMSNDNKLAAVAFFVSPQLLEHRINRLLGGTREAPPPRMGRAWAATATVLTLLWFIGVASSAAHAAHLPQASEICRHHHHGVLHDKAGHIH